MSLSPVIVLSIGCLLGTIIKGLTGFGSAIIHLAVWVMARAVLRIDAGTLQQAVVSECISGWVVAVPLVVVTKAHVTADKAVVVLLSVFGALSAPLGAAMLSHLHPRIVELVMGCVLLLVVAMRCNLLHHIQALGKVAGWGGSKSRYSKVSSDDGSVVARKSSEQRWPADSDLPVTGVPNRHVMQQVAADCPQTSEGPQNRLTQQPAQLQHCQAQREQLWQQQQQQQQQAVGATATCAEGASNSPVAGQTAAPQLHIQQCTGCSKDVLVQQQPQTPLQPSRTADESGWRAHCHHLVPPQCHNKDVVKLVAYSSIAGTIGGVMGALTGMSEPPLMLMYSMLQMPKEVVRGTNAVLNILQPRIIFYWLEGVFKKEDLPIYASTAASGVLGMIIGNSMAGRIDQKAFDRVLLGLIVMCCALMFASAAGLAGD